MRMRVVSLIVDNNVDKLPMQWYKFPMQTTHRQRVMVTSGGRMTPMSGDIECRASD
jgi:hypothetical protein